MSHEHVRGFVLREVALGEADRLIEILTAQKGLVTALARGSRRMKSPLLAATQIFALSDFTLFNYKGRTTIDSAELVEPFLRLREDLDRLVCAAHLAEVFHDLVRDDLSDDRMYVLWAYSCHAILSQPDPLLATHVAQLKALAVSGFTPALTACQVCGTKQLPSGWFDFQAHGLLCPEDFRPAQAQDVQHLSAPALACLHHILQSPAGRLFAFSVSDAVKNEVRTFSERYLTVIMEKKYQRLSLLQDL
ncbi:MAG: DNA repair protein RecO [Clostridia bacterium]|nr:DNA repair protein RecO [Clostridia bacterium]NCC74908.1 DNA repair protein RecO [Clostridia bacterium]